MLTPIYFYSIKCSLYVSHTTMCWFHVCYHERRTVISALPIRSGLYADHSHKRERCLIETILYPPQTTPPTMEVSFHYGELPLSAVCTGGGGGVIGDGEVVTSAPYITWLKRPAMVLGARESLA